MYNKYNLSSTMKRASPERRTINEAVYNRNPSLTPFSPTSYVFCLSFSFALSCRSFHSRSTLSYSSFSFLARSSSRRCFALLPDVIVAARSTALPLTPTFACKRSELISLICGLIEHYFVFLSLPCTSTPTVSHARY